MKKSLLLFALVLLLAGCASTGNQTAPAGGTPAVSPSEEPGLTAGAPEKMTCRIVDGAEEGELVLAGPGGAGDVYTLDTEGLAVDGTLADGAMVEVGFDGMILETYPAKFGHVTGVTVLEELADDRCGLYLQVLSDLWEVDTALNTGLEELGVDLSGLTDLAESEKSALAWVFGNAHGLMPITGTLEEIWEAGYLTPMTGPAEGYEDSVALYRWENGCLFSLSGSAEEGFEAQKWASGLGAYFFTGCTARQNADGTWTYEVGAEAIA